MFNINNIKKDFTVNKNKIPVNMCESLEDWNSAIDYCIKQGYINGINRTKYGNYASNGHQKRGYEVVSYVGSMCGWMLWVRGWDGNWCYQFNPTMDEHGNPIAAKEEQRMVGTLALNSFIHDLKDLTGIELRKYALPLEEAEVIKETIPKPIIAKGSETVIEGVIYNNVYHMDINSAYPAGLKKAYPEFAPVIDTWYEIKNTTEDPERKKDVKLKLNSFIGKMHSKSIGYKYAQLAYAAKKFCNDEVMKMAKYLREHKCSILLYNTDGIWFKPQGEEIPPLDTGNGLGEWKMDHHATRFRIKSKGTYEFEEDNQYHAVKRGRCKFDRIKPDRTTWQWGDIFREECDLLIMLELTEDGHLRELEIGEVPEYLETFHEKRILPEVK